MRTYDVRLSVNNPTPIPQMPDYLTVREAARRLCSSKNLVYTWIRRGKLQAYKIGRKTLVKSEDVEALVVPAKLEPAFPKAATLPESQATIIEMTYTPNFTGVPSSPAMVMSTETGPNS